PEQVAAARSYILNNPDTILAEHLKIEARMAAGNPVEVIERARQTHEMFQSFRNRLANREQSGDEVTQGTPASSENAPRQFPTFRESLEQQSNPAETK